MPTSYSKHPDQLLRSLVGVAATGPGDDYQFTDSTGKPDSCSSFTWQTRFTGTPTAITVNLEGSIDAVVGTDGAVAASATAFTSAKAAFLAGDVGKAITIKGAGAAGADLVTTIAAYVSATAVTLSDAAGTTVTGATYTYGSWFTLDSSTSTTAEMRHVVNKRVQRVRANISAYTVNSSTCTVAIRGYNTKLYS